MREIVIIVSLLAILAFSGCLQESDSGDIKFGLQATPESAIVQVAKEKGFFEENSINVEIVEFTAGKFALQAFLAGDLDLAVVGDLPIVLAKMQGNDFYVLGEIAVCPKENPMLVIDDGSADPKEYFSKSKRKITTSIGGTPEFYTYNFLKYYGISEEEVEIIAQKPEEMVSTLTSGSVDAMSIFEPYPSIAEKLLPGKTKRFEIPDEIYSPRYVVVVSKKLVNENPEKVISLVKAMFGAEEFIQNNSKESQEIVAEVTGFEEDIITKIWGKCNMRLGASDELILVWNDEAAWAIETGKIEASPIPNFEELVRKEILNEAKSS